MKKKLIFFGGVLAVFLLWMSSGIASPEAASILQGTAETPAVSWTSILPPLVAIGIALLFRQVLLALFLGIWCGALLGMGFSFENIFITFFTTLTDYIVPATADTGHMSIIIFTLLIGGMVGIIT